MKSSSTGFRDNTWPTLVELAGKIYNYATRAGGTEKRSYYANMLDWAKQYNRESNKDDPDEDLLEDLLSSVQGACKKQVKEINAFMQQSADMRDALHKFDNACHEHESKLDTIITAIQTKLGTLDGNGQGKYSGKIGELRKKIENNQAILEQEMKEYDKGSVKPFFPMLTNVWSNIIIFARRQDRCYDSMLCLAVCLLS